MTTRLAITPGEPAGIGPDLCVQLAQSPPPGTELVFVADRAVLASRAQALSLPLELPAWEATRGAPFSLLQVESAAPVEPGRLAVENAPYVLDCLTRAVDEIRAGRIDALVTGPVQKSIINDAGIAFSGHTEFLADYCGVELTVMMLATEGLRVAVATTHLPLAEVPGAITRESLGRVIDILHADLISKFGIPEPRILVCGLNPHAGEGGHLGREELDTIEPVLVARRAQGMRLLGPLPADTLFTPKYLDQADAVLAMYHDQGLPVLKFKGFGRSSNITLGLPIVRTSVDHGTALDLAASGRAEIGSLSEAIHQAQAMAAAWTTREASSRRQTNG